MRRLRRQVPGGLALGASLALALLAPTTIAAVARASVGARAAAAQAPLDGVNIEASLSSSPAALEHQIAEAHALGAKLVRVEVQWAAAEPVRGRIEPRVLASTGRLVAAAAADGMRVIMLVDSTPCWTSSAPPALLRKCNPGGSRANGWQPKSAAAYGAFVAYLARLYGSRLAAIEVWNEPDLSDEAFFAGPDKIQHYAALVRVAYRAIKRANPKVLVLAGSLVGYNGVFLRGLYKAGMKGYYDGLAVHFYTDVLAKLRTLRQAQLRAGDHTPVWLDEFGWTSCYPSAIQQSQHCVTPALQAQNLRNTFRSLARTSWVAAAVSYELQDSDHQDFGLLKEGGQQKPAFAAVREAFASPFGPVEPVRLSLSVRDGHVQASGSAPVGDELDLEAFQGSVLRYRSVFLLNRFNGYSIALPAVLGTSGLRVTIYRVWSGPGSAVQKTI